MASTFPEGGEPRQPTGRAGERSQGYWRANLRLQLLLLAVWALIAYVLSILLAEVLNRVDLVDLPLGFWFAQQAAIYVFVVLIFIYALRMDRVDREYDVHEEEVGWARKRVEARMQRRLTGEAPTKEPEQGGETR